MPTLHLLHGLPGTGKSTYAKTLAEKDNAIIFNNDEWMIKLYGSNPSEKKFQGHRNTIESLQWNLAEQLLKKGTDVIWDYGLWTELERTEIKKKTKSLNIKTLLYRFNCSPKIATTRVLNRNKHSKGQTLEINEHALKAFREMYQPVNDNEGFDIIEATTVHLK